MFFHNLKYEIKTVLREKSFIIWLILFPMILGSLFKVAFGSIYEKDIWAGSIPVAVVKQSENAVFDGVLSSLTEGEEPVLKVTEADDSEAKKMLFAGEVKGILYVGKTVELSVSGRGMSQTILQEITESCHVYEKVIRDAMETNPAAIEPAIRALSAEAEACCHVPLTKGNPDVYVQYFYNLIAMVAICGTLTGLHVATCTQANQSEIAARKNISAVPKSIHLTAGLLGSCISQSVSMITTVSFIRVVLRINLGGNLFLVYVSALRAGILGVTMGFFVGCIGRAKFEVKTAVTLSCSMALCFLSGLMMGNMKGILAAKAPWVNRVNPVAIVSGCFYCLNIYSDYRRFLSKLCAMGIYIVAFTVLGVVLSRRKKYASI